MPTMPYEIVEFPFAGRTRRYKKYPAGSIPANDEESATWDYVKWMEKEVLAVRGDNERLKDELAKAQAKGGKR